MIPFAHPNLLHPSNDVDYRIAKSHSQESSLNWSFSRAIFRLVNVVDRIVS
jgi:hypothetical protein